MVQDGLHRKTYDITEDFLSLQVVPHFRTQSPQRDPSKMLRVGRLKRSSPKEEMQEGSVKTDKDDAPITPAKSSNRPSCNCTQITMKIAHTIASIPPFSSLETKESGISWLEQILDPIANQGICKICADKYHFPDLLNSICRKSLKQCELYHAFLAQIYQKLDDQPLLERDYPAATFEERASLLCMLSYLQIRRLHQNIGRLIRLFEYKPTFDMNSWSNLREEAYQLAIKSATLSSCANYP